MPDFSQVAHPTFYPHGCIVCQSSTGPLVDTGNELAEGSGSRHVYLCALCVKLSARTLGLVKGERMEQLLKAGALLDTAKKDVEERDKQIEAMLASSASDRRKIEALDDLLQKERNEATTRMRLAEMIHENSRQLIGANGA